MSDDPELRRKTLEEIKLILRDRFGDPAQDEPFADSMSILMVLGGMLIAETLVAAQISPHMTAAAIGNAGNMAVRQMISVAFDAMKLKTN